MVLMHDTLSECAIHLYEISLKYLRLSIYRADTIWDWQTDVMGKNNTSMDPSRGET